MTIREDFKFLINGQLEGSDKTFDVINPSTEEVIARCPDASQEQLDQAVAAARKAFLSWRETSFEERAKQIERLADALFEHAGDLAALLTLEQGKPVGQSYGEIAFGAVGRMRGLDQLQIPVEVLQDDEAYRVELQYRPLGVIGAITPWNVPILMAAGKIAQSVYAGNTIILKPSSFSPLSTLKFAELAQDIFPTGVINVLTSAKSMGRWISEHEDIDKVSFTGSTETGKRVMIGAAGTMKRCTLELGGNDAAIVLADVDPKAVAAKLFTASFINNGQTCMGIKRIYAHESIYEELCEAMADLARNAKCGDGFEEGVEFGPINNRNQYDSLIEFLDDTRRIGAKILAGGNVADGPGFFIDPTVVCDIDDDALLVKEEQFGPIIPIVKFSDPEDALARANNSIYGLAGSVWGADLEAATALANRLEAGTAWVNTHANFTPNTPFGGAKQSGVGCEYG
ncbi:MAG: aldehyde dehydrogenase family protein, partial [Pseudomonadales bacterium]